MDKIIIRPIAYVKNERQDPLVDDFWGEMVSEITLVHSIPDIALKGLEKISHLEIMYYYHNVNKDDGIEFTSRARDNKKWPIVGIFSQRKKRRPNYLGSTIVKLLTRVDNKLYVQNLDVINGTPIVDIKPVYKEFLPIEEIEQPKWITQLMRDYWEVSV